MYNTARAMLVLNDSEKQDKAYDAQHSSLGWAFYLCFYLVIHTQTHTSALTCNMVCLHHGGVDPLLEGCSILSHLESHFSSSVFCLVGQLGCGLPGVGLHPFFQVFFFFFCKTLHTILKTKTTGLKDVYETNKLCLPSQAPPALVSTHWGVSLLLTWPKTLKDLHLDLKVGYPI